MIVYMEINITDKLALNMSWNFLISWEMITKFYHLVINYN